MPRSQGRPQLAFEDPAVVGPRLPFPHPHEMPAGSSDCKGQKPQEGGEGCSASDLAYWFKDSVIHPKPPTEPPQPSHGITLAQLPAACRQVLAAPDAKQ